MLWNWYAVDACFISSQWHVRSKGGWFLLLALLLTDRNSS